MDSKSTPSLPPVELRTGGGHFLTDEDWRASARAEAERLTGSLDLGADDVLLDFGCGAGRLAIGLAQGVVHPARYVGVDVRPDAIEWCVQTLVPQFTWMRFEVSHAYNERYRPDGRAASPLPFEDGTFSFVYAYSVFSHLRWYDTMSYLAELSRLARIGATAFISAFVEPSVPDEVVNPSDYGALTWKGPLHCVRFSERAFHRYLDEAGWSVISRTPGSETDGQTGYLLRKVAAPVLLMAEPDDRRSVAGRLLAFYDEVQTRTRRNED